MRDAIKNAKRIVVKVGSSTLCYPNGHLNLERIEHLVRQLSDLANQGRGYSCFLGGYGCRPCAVRI
mgnify:CR=1 FL=1